MPPRSRPPSWSIRRSRRQPSSGAPDAKFGEVGLIVVVAREGTAPTAESILQTCADHLARYKIPKRVVFADALPYSPYGKVQKANLRRRYLGSD